MKVENLLKKICITLTLAIPTVVRIIISLKIPLFMQGDAAADDYLYIRYAKSLLADDYLGTFDGYTLVKSLSYAIYLYINNIIGMPYRLALILFYIFAISTLVYVLNKIIKSTYFSVMLYLFLLYSPVMLHNENIQKVYRGGVLVSSSILVIGCVVGIYASEKKIEKIFWSILGALALPFFYYVKEDSIWIMPFICVIVLMYCVKNLIVIKGNIRNKVWNLLLIFIPIISLMIVTVTYKKINQKYYGEYTITDRGSTNFKNVIHDLLVISEVNGGNKKIWITKRGLEKAESYSPTLKKYEPVKKMYDTVNVSVYYGDLSFWAFRYVFNDEYNGKKNGIKINRIYGKIDSELKDVIKIKHLDRSKEIYISSVAKGLSKKDLLWIWKNWRKYLKVLVSYKYNELSVNVATGDSNSVNDMIQITNTPAVTQEIVNTKWGNQYKDVISVVQKYVVGVYQKTGKWVFLLGLLGLMVVPVFVVKNKDYQILSLMGIVVGLLSSVIPLFVGVQWFSNFLGYKKFYDYICCAVPIMQVLEALGLLMLVRSINIIMHKLKNLRRKNA
ncbi:hypothetical protein SY111_15040 [Ligilactobacillus agilis]|uniref:Glycosyltransferase RgtA/B/C/D-like domain-containing protein n=1 Tax=Ligilactobacillus agilis TaxID=1601 RepID=A0A6F9XUR7_9LACO|nr:hypothetical protein [Ligilactobacillus agilis]GET08880.1 hypothetical protein SY111_15040 [Ligilactobacillus agilis]